MQELFQSKYEWGEPLSDDLTRRWNSMITELEQLNQIEEPRYYFQGMKEKPEKLDLFGFCDISERAYAAVVYAKVKLNRSSAIVLVSSISRMVHLPRKTIPRLELLSCLILARLITSVKETLSSLFNVEIVRCWTDSVIAYYWVRSIEKKWKPFVKNRVQKYVNSFLQYHCPGRGNAADIPKITIKLANITVNSVW